MLGEGEARPAGPAVGGRFHRIQTFLLFSTIEMTCTGMCRVRVALRRSRMLQPSTTGSWMSSVMAVGCSSFASASRCRRASRPTAFEASPRAMPTMTRGELHVVLEMRNTRSPSRSARGRRRPLSARSRPAARAPARPGSPGARKRGARARVGAAARAARGRLFVVDHPLRPGSGPAGRM